MFGSRNGGHNFGLLTFSSSVPFSGAGVQLGPAELVTNAQTAGQGIFAGAFSPDGKKMALVAGSIANGFNLYIVKRRRLQPHPAGRAAGVTACQISWRSDSKELAVMQPNGQCAPAATGKIVGVDLSNPGNLSTLAPLGAHPAWQPVVGG